MPIQNTCVWYALPEYLPFVAAHIYIFYGLEPRAVRGGPLRNAPVSFRNFEHLRYSCSIACAQKLNEV